MRYIISFALASLLAMPLPGQAEVPRVVTDLPPVGSLVAQVLGDLGVPVVLLDKGADAHSFQLRPSQAADLAAAQAIIWIGPEMTPWLERAAAGLNDGAADLRLLALPGTVVAQAPAAAHDEGHEDGHGAGHGDGHDPAEGGVDPHVWLNPDNAEIWLQAIARLLSDLDPGNAATYGANAAAARAAVAALDDELRALLAPARGVPLVVFHDAYGAFADHYGLTVLGALGGSDAASPGAAHLRDLQTRMAGTAVCLFPEVNHDAGQIAGFADLPGVRVGAALDPEGAALDQGPALYAGVLRAMAGAIADCAAP